MREPVRETDDILPDAQLVIAARAGDRSAEEALYLRHAQRVHRLALHLLSHRADAAELAQESFAVALERLGQLREPAAFAGWLRRIVIHGARRVLRRRRLRRRLGFEEMAPGIDADFFAAVTTTPDAQAELRQLGEAIGDWPADERLVFCMQQFESMEIDEIVGLTGWSRATVNRRLKRARQRLDDLRRGR